MLFRSGHFKAVCNYCKKTYLTDSKGHGTTNLLNHTPICVKNPNIKTLKGQQTLAFEPKMVGRKGFNLYRLPLLLRLLERHLLKLL